MIIMILEIKATLIKNVLKCFGTRKDYEIANSTMFIQSVETFFLCMALVKLQGKLLSRDELVPPGRGRRCNPFRFGISFILCAFACNLVNLVYQSGQDEFHWHHQIMRKLPWNPLPLSNPFFFRCFANFQFKEAVCHPNEQELSIQNAMHVIRDWFACCLVEWKYHGLLRILDRPFSRFANHHLSKSCP